MANLEILDLRGNIIGDSGMAAIADAIAANGAMANLQTLGLAKNSIGTDGMAAFADAIAARAGPWRTSRTSGLLTNPLLSCRHCARRRISSSTASELQMRCD